MNLVKPILVCVLLIVSSSELTPVGQALSTLAQNSTHALSPALPRSKQVGDLNAKILGELEQVAAAFDSAGIDASRVEATLRVVKQIDQTLARTGAERSFEEQKPSVGVLRQIALISAPGSRNAAAEITRIISSFERSPKPAFTYYEYSDSSNLASSQIRANEGTEDSWKAQARPGLEPGEKIAVKKCRHVLLLGWYCMTTLNWILPLASASSGQIVFSVLMDLRRTPDHAMFAGDDRRLNTIDGSTSLYLVKQAGDLVLVYNLGYQLAEAGAPNAIIQEQLREGLQTEYKQLLQRLEHEFGRKGLRWSLLRLSQ